MAQKFNFTMDQKVTTWNRTTFVVTAETEEQAREIAKSMLSADGADNVTASDDPAVELVETQTLYEAEEDMSVEDNGGMATQELYAGRVTSPANMIGDNAHL